MLTALNRWGALTLLLLLLAAGLRLAWVEQIVPTPTHDAKWYVARAKSFAAGKGISVSDRPTAYRPIGYSVALGAAYSAWGIDDSLPGRLNVVFGAVTLLLLFFAAKRITGSAAAARWTLLLYALYPTDIAYTSLAISEPMFNASMMAGTLAALSGSRWVSIGVAALAFAIATVTRAQGIILPVVVGLFAASQATRRARLLHAGLLGGAVIVCLLPWWQRNYAAFQHFVPLANNGGVNLYIGNNPRATGGYRFDRRVTAQTEGIVPQNWLGAGGPKEYEADRAFAQLAREYIAAQPWEALSRAPAKLRALYATDHAAFEWNRSYRNKPLALYDVAYRCSRYYYALLWALALAGLVRIALSHRAAIGIGVAVISWACLWIAGASWVMQVATVALVLLGGTPRCERPLLPLAIMAAFTLLQLAYFGDARFHHAVMPWVCVYGGALLARGAHVIQGPADDARTLLTALRDRVAAIDARAIASKPR